MVDRGRVVGRVREPRKAHLGWEWYEDLFVFVDGHKEVSMDYDNVVGFESVIVSRRSWPILLISEWVGHRQRR